MRKKNYKLIVIIMLLTPIISYAQYTLQSAFPNLPLFNFPVELVHADDGTNRLFLLQQRGLIYVFNNTATVSSRKVFLDLTSKVSPAGYELGLLGLAFHPDYENNKYFYVHYSFDSASAHWVRISRYKASSVNPDSALMSSENILMTVAKPEDIHNGGKLSFGPDGYLYISIGDGGRIINDSAFSQSKKYLLGKILRINVDSATGGRQYSIPATNPYYGNNNGDREEIFALGFRNTWKFSIDYPTNRIWGGDVGEDSWEEINIIENGKNYGWYQMEGSHCFFTCDTAGKGFTGPVYDYPHSLGSSIIGGYVYRGESLPGLYEKYIYADYISGRVWALTYDGVNPATSVELFDTDWFISSLGVDQNNELYVVKTGYNTGQIYKIVNPNIAALRLSVAIEGLYDDLHNRLNVMDTVRVYTRQKTSPYLVVDSARAIIDSLSLTGKFYFSNTPTGKYYFQVKYKNGLETWSKTGGDSLLRGDTTTYDFTNSSSKAFGNNEILKGSKYCIYSGDINGNGFIDLDDILLAYNNASIFAMGYLRTDLNGDRITDLNDLLLLYQNSSDVISKILP